MVSVERLGVGAPQLAGVEAHGVDVLGVLALEVRVGVGQQVRRAGRARPCRCARGRTPAAGCGRRADSPWPAPRRPTANGGGSSTSRSEPGAVGVVVGLVRLRDRRLLDVLPAQLAGPGVDRAGGEDRAVDEHDLGGVEPAPVVAVVEVLRRGRAARARAGTRPGSGPTPGPSRAASARTPGPPTFSSNTGSSRLGGATGPQPSVPPMSAILIPPPFLLEDACAR